MLKADNPSLRDIQLTDFVSYAQNLGWKIADHTKREYILTGESDDDGQPLEIILPTNSAAPDYFIYLSDAIHLISDLREVPAESTVAEIVHGDRDIVTIKVDEDADADGIPLDVATKQIAAIKRLIAYSACSERDALPFFTSIARSKGLIKRYIFGHTVPGIFSYTIHTQLSEAQIIKPTQQLSLPFEDFEDIPEVVIYPIERRIIERLARGITHSNEAQEHHNINPIVQNYADGLNANMCAALVKILKSADERKAIEFSFSWGYKVKLADDLQNQRVIKVRPRSIKLLEEAQEFLSKATPQHEKIRGTVVGLLSNTPPLAVSGDTNVLIRWQRDRGRSVVIQVALSKADYIKAIEAHEKWDTVEVVGIPEKKMSGYKLNEPKGFNVLK